MASRMRAAAAVARMRQKGWEEEHGGMQGDSIGMYCCFCHLLLPWKESCHPTQLLCREAESVLGQMT